MKQTHYEKSPVDPDGYLDFTGWTLEELVRVCPRYGPEGRSNFVFDEAIGALVVRAESRAKVENALIDRADTVQGDYVLYKS